MRAYRIPKRCLPTNGLLCPTELKTRLEFPILEDQMMGLSLDQNLIPRDGSYHDVKPANEIFVVDDDESMREILTLVLSLEGVTVTGFEEGKTLLTRAREQTPICVFLDVIFPGRTGIRTLQELKSLQFEAPNFLMSARDDTSTVVDGIKHGAHDFLRKPSDPYASPRCVRKSIELRNARVKAASVPESGTKDAPNNVRLTRREIEVLRLVVQGKSSKDIAKSIGTSKRTVDCFRTSLLRKLSAKILLS
jgi:two-component system response regulator FixJ